VGLGTRGPTGRSMASQRYGLACSKLRSIAFSYRGSLAGNKKGEIEVEVQFLSNLHTIYISGSACSTVGVHSQAWSTSGIGRLGSKSGRG
jgi:hypothetical protein